MLKIENVSSVKKKFNQIKKLANTCIDATIKIKPKYNLIEFILGEFSFNATLEKDNIHSSYKTVILSVHPNDTIFDLLFDKDGFFYSTYNNAYSQLKIIAPENGTEYFVSQIVFHTRKRSYDYRELTFSGFPIITD